MIENGMVNEETRLEVEDVKHVFHGVEGAHGVQDRNGG